MHDLAKTINADLDSIDSYADALIVVNSEIPEKTNEIRTKVAQELFERALIEKEYMSMHDLAHLNRLNCKINAAEAEFNRVSATHCTAHSQDAKQTADRLLGAWEELQAAIVARNEYRRKMLENYDLVEITSHG